MTVLDAVVLIALAVGLQKAIHEERERIRRAGEELERRRRRQ